VNRSPLFLFILGFAAVTASEPLPAGADWDEPDSPRIQAVRLEALSILEAYSHQGRPFLTSHVTKEREDALRLAALARALEAEFPQRFEPNRPSENLARLLEKRSPVLAAQLRSKAPSQSLRKSIEFRIEELRREALSIYERYSETGGPAQSPRAESALARKYEASAYRRLIGIADRVSILAPGEFPQAKPRQTLARLMESLPTQGPALAQLILADPRSELFRYRLEVWQAVREGHALPPELRTRKPNRVPTKRYNWTPRDATVEDIRLSALRILHEYEGTGGPRGRLKVKTGQAPSEAEFEEVRAYNRLTRLSNKLHELDSARFDPGGSRENLARLFEGEPHEGEALAALLRVRASTSDPEFQARLSAWLKIRKELKLGDCMASTLEDGLPPSF
jgi:hypothetical protein